MILIILSVIILVIVGIVIYCMTGSSLHHETQNIAKGEKDSRSIIIYFSRSNALDYDDEIDASTHASLNLKNNHIEGNTEIAAKMIQEKTGADLYSIQVSKSYRTPFLATSLRAWLEKYLNIKPDLSNMPENLDDYDVIYLGYPIWWYKEPMAVDTFLENYDLSEKTIIPFCTSTSSSIDESVQSIQKICPHSHILEGLRMEQANEKEIDEWLKKINIGGENDEYI